VSVTFVPDSKLSRLEAMAFSQTGLTIVIPASVEFIGKYCFAYCQALVSVVFAADSKFTPLEHGAFEDVLPSTLSPIELELIAILSGN
jgi:hypothetical protein